MSTLAKYFTFVNQQIAFHERQATRYTNVPKRFLLHTETASNFKALLSDLQIADATLENQEAPGKPITLAQQLTLFPHEYGDLPDELKKELSVSDADKTEHLIIKIIEEAGGIISLDRLLYSLYKKTGEIHKRVTMTSKMYRMSQKGYAYPVPGKKGVYSIRQLTEPEVARLFASVEEAPENS